MRGYGWILVLFLSVAASSALARDFDPAPINALRPGVTTMDEAIASLGEPDSRAPSLNSHSTLIYEYDIVRAGEAASTHIMLVLLFDPEGKFVRYQVYRRD